MHIKTKIVDVDEGFRLARNVRLEVGPKEVVAPRRALATSQNRQLNETILKNGTIRGLAEFYRHVDHEKLQKMMHENGELARFSYELSSSLKEVKTDKEITIGILEYNSGGKIPGHQETELLLDLLNNPLLDITVPPIIPKLPCESYMTFLDEFSSIHKSSSFAPALCPCIPHYSRLDIANLFEYYTKKDSFARDFMCVDFNGGNPISQFTFVSMIVREAISIENKFGEPVFLHALNLKYGKATKKQVAVPAKDLLVFTMGFNSFGANHKILPIVPAIGSYEMRTKLLNRNDYGYYDLNIADKIIAEAQKPEIELKAVLSNEKISKLFNAERQGLETNRISQNIKEHNYKKYIESKELIKNEVEITKKIGRVHEEALQKKL